MINIKEEFYSNFKKKRGTIFMLFLTLFILISCADKPRYSIPYEDSPYVSPERLQKGEKILGTADKDARVYHQVVTDSDSIPLTFDGYIIGVEKGPKERVSKYKRTRDSLGEDFYDRYLDNIYCSHALFPEENTVDKSCNVPSIANRDARLATGWKKSTLIKDLLQGVGWDHEEEAGKRHFISHIYSYSPADIKKSIKPVYNVYLDIARSHPDNGVKEYKSAFSAGMSALQGALKDDLEIRLMQAETAGKSYTHIFFCSMGWNALQEKAIGNFNSLFEQLRKQALKRDDTGFRPLVIGITWPATWADTWYTEKASYWNKAADADEIGTTIAASLLDQVILPLKSFDFQALDKQRKVDVKVVILAHSFGVRLTSSALFLKDLVYVGRKPLSKNVVDLYIGLEGAVSSNRFLAASNGKKHGKEGQPYVLTGFPDTKFVYTWSQYDTANPITATFPVKLWSGAKHIGGTPGFNNLTELFEGIEEGKKPLSIHFSRCS